MLANPRFLCPFVLMLPAWAGTIVDSGAPVRPPFGPELTLSEISNGFTLPSGSLLAGFSFWTGELQGSFAGYLGSFKWAIYKDSGGVPGQVVLNGTAQPVRQTDGITYSVINASALVYQNSVAFAPTQVAAGDYWLGLRNGDGQSVFAGVLWDQTAAQSLNSSLSRTRLSNGAWNNSGLSLAFQIIGTADVPEPGTWLLTTGGLLGLAGVVRRRRSSSAQV